MSFVTPTAPRYRPVRQAAYRRAEHVLPTPLDASAIVRTLFATHSTPDDITTGEHWYQNGHAYCQGLALEHGVTARAVAGIVAALSPQTSWDLNLALAAEFLEHGHAAHTGDANRKCAAIVAGADPTAVLGGRKVRSFFRNLAEPDRPGPVTLDRHAVAIVLGRPVTSSDRPLETPGTYQRLAAGYRHAARTLGYHPHTLQAVTWVTWRRIHAPAFHARDTANGVVLPF